ncbi:TonB-dependent receptor domain-containing protein [Sphingomonas sp.]|uniref:TonB-dependent receptor domain-containing protein n=1 Tax=Sphingomonas sp. TaxID=28214 RepID=UPI0035BC45DC
MRPEHGGLALAVLVSVPGMARAPQTRSFDIPAGTLADAVIAVGTQANVTVGLTVPDLAVLRVPRLVGRMPVAEALRRLLAGTPASFVQVDGATFRIVRRREPRIAPSLPSAPPVVPADIVVTATKRAVFLTDYPGGVVLADVSRLRPNRPASGSQALVDQLPMLSSTHLGPGRNKLFIRGIADSSFSGPTQATVGQYLGDVRLNYSAPDPDLSLHDIAAVEVLEGPQGTLYGAGSLGGILRLVPVQPSLTDTSLLIESGVATTAKGTSGGDLAAIVNLPIRDGVLAARAVGYGSVEGGYIDDRGRGRADINRTTTRGGRIILRIQPSTNWTIDVGAVRQDINSRDGQYAERGLPPLERSSAISQPFDNDYTLGSIVVRHTSSATTLTSVSSAVSHELTSSFDATDPVQSSSAVPRLFREQERVMLLSNETRLARTTAGGNWVIGAEFLHSSDRLSRVLGPVASPAALPGTRNVVTEGSLFGEITRSVFGAVSATVGARAVLTRLIAETREAAAPAEEPHRHASSFLPSIGVLWRAQPRLSIFARYQEGFRPGGLSTGQAVTQRFESDTVSSVETGLRYGATGDRFSASATVSHVNWENIQADLVSDNGLPYVANIGSGSITGFEAQVSWRPMPEVTAEGAVFAANSGLEHPAPGFASRQGDSLPNVAAVVARGAIRASLPVAGKAVEIEGSVRYAGPSRLGVGTVLDLDQGRYVETALGASVPVGPVTLSLDATNLFDARGNVFALGNPFSVAAGRQVTPLRPRTLRLGTRVAF